MKIIFLKKYAGIVAASLLAMGCGSTVMVSTPIGNIDSTPLKIADLNEQERKTWSHADLVSDTIPGMSVDKAYEQLIGNQKGKTVIVAVLDSGIDLNHEDLRDVIWTNSGEKPGNNVDDDKNGFVDDVHGFNFLGPSYNERLEYTRIVALHLGDAGLQARAKAKLDEEIAKTTQNKERYSQILDAVKAADAALKEYLGKDSYTKDDLMAIESEDEELNRNISVLMQMYNYKDTIPEVIKELNDGLTYFSGKLQYHLNVDFNGRTAVGDDPYDATDISYGNGNPQAIGEDESHGTHVAGIIAAERNNGTGMDGVANNVQIMSVRAVPNGDEYDKDISRGIRYAVDNGASIINCSFGKAFSPKKEWLYDALKYAAEHDVLIVKAAGNDALDLDEPENAYYPNDYSTPGQEVVDNMITVGALNSTYGSEMIASFSNYGAMDVDVFAPGGDIYSTIPHNKYEFESGTSMAAPAVTGVAALIRSYFPKLTAPEVKQILMDSGLSTKISVILGGDADNSASFSNISKSGKMVNAYNALILASQVANGKIKI